MVSAEERDRLESFEDRDVLRRIGWNGTSFLSVAEGEPVLLVHQEHDSLPVPAGAYEVRRQREYVPLRVSRWVSD